MSNEKFSSTKPKRSSNIELFRIITMLIIVAHHYVVNSGLLACIDEKSVLDLKDYFLLILGWGGKTGINCFVLITGYYMCKSKITFKKYMKLLAEVIFYSIVIYFLFVLSGYIQFSRISLTHAIFPFFDISSGFTSCFLLFYLFIPYINILVNNMNEKQHIRLILLCAFIYTVLPSLLKGNVIFNYITWFTIIYIIASYLRIYQKEIFDNKLLITLLLIFSILLSWLSVIVIANSTVNQSGAIYTCYHYVNDSNKILALITSVFAFLFFKNLNIEYSQTINKIAASTFGVLQIHTNGEYMRTWLWQTVCKNVQIYQMQSFIVIFLHSVVSVILIYTICTFIDQLRIKYLETHFLKFIDKIDL